MRISIWSNRIDRKEFDIICYWKSSDRRENDSKILVLHLPDQEFVLVETKTSQKMLMHGKTIK